VYRPGESIVDPLSEEAGRRLSRLVLLTNRATQGPRWKRVLVFIGRLPSGDPVDHELHAALLTAEYEELRRGLSPEALEAGGEGTLRDLLAAVRS
jgi:hypothetical protein